MLLCFLLKIGYDSSTFITLHVMNWICSIILRNYLCLLYELNLSITSSMDNPVHAMKFPCFSILSSIPFKNDYQKGKLVLVLLMTYLLSLLMKIDKKVSASHKPQGLLFTQRKKGKSKGMGTLFPINGYLL